MLAFGGGGRARREGWYAGNVFLGSHGATPPPLLLASRPSVALCRAYRRACGLVHLIPQRAHTYTRSSEDHECTYTVHALSHHRKTVAVAGGVGRAATPLDRLRCCETRQRAISGRPYPSEDEEGGVLLSKRVCVRCVANVRTYEWVYVATCVRVRCVVEPLIARGKGEKRRFLCSLFAETRDTGILESVKGAVCVRSNRRKKVVSILRWIFFVNFSVVRCTVVVRGVASRFSV